MKGNPQYREIDNHLAQVRLLLQGNVEVIIDTGLVPVPGSDLISSDPPRRPFGRHPGNDE